MLIQKFFPNHKLFYAGESLTVEVQGIPSIPGRTVFRTNLGGAAQRNKELIEEHLYGTPPPGLDWHDIEIPFDAVSNCYSITLPLPEIGVFEGKCCFIPDDGSPLHWPEGKNFQFKVEPPEQSGGTTIYAAFTRQFGPDMKQKQSGSPAFEEKVLAERRFTVVPPSGTFRQLIKQLDHIFGTLHCNILQLLPIHPVPVSFGRMGRYGSPFAALDYFSIDPSLAEFDESATAMEQFLELVSAVHLRGGKIYLDIPVNHTGWGSKLQIEHPDYFVRDTQGNFESPGAWGVVWKDLCRLDYSKPEVANVMAKVFLFWSRYGVDGFRCDAGYMVPESAWKFITSKVRQEFPQTVFLLEGLGGPPKVQHELLNSCGLDIAYSELFQNYNRDQIEYYLPQMLRSSEESGNLVSFAETHDNDRLGAKGAVYAKLRFCVCSLLSSNGGFGFANGAEFFAPEKIDVHGAGALNYGAEPNFCKEIGRINDLLAHHPAFFGHSKLQLITRGGGNCIAALRTDEQGRNKVVILLNLDCQEQTLIHFAADVPLFGTDLLTDRDIQFNVNGNEYSCLLAPGEALAVEFRPAVREDIIQKHLERTMEQRAFIHRFGWCNERRCSCSFTDSPEQFAVELSQMNPPPMTTWEFPRDTRRIVPLPWGDWLLVHSKTPFRCMVNGDATSFGYCNGLKLRDGSYGVLLSLKPNDTPEHRLLTLHFLDFGVNPIKSYHCKINQLSNCSTFQVRSFYSQTDIAERGLLVFGSNDSGSYALFSAGSENVTSKYQALLAINPDPNLPVDRIALLTGLDCWVNIAGYSSPVNLRAVERFGIPNANHACWDFRIPVGQGCLMDLHVDFLFAEHGDGLQLKFRRGKVSGGKLPDSDAVQLILRPELEYRSHHTVTHAFHGEESHFPASVSSSSNGFTFQPQKIRFYMESNRGKYYSAPEWHYQCDLPFERYYGLEDKTDRFSPGYFQIPLRGGDEVTLFAGVTPQSQCIYTTSKVMNSDDAFRVSLRRFVVKRGELATVIAGYPWFLDWGRDTLIVLRGLVHVPEFQEQCAAIIRAFAGFEKQGMLPNVLLGESASNFDTSDAPLYLIVATRDYIEATGDRAILQSDCRGRTLEQVLDSIIENYIKGTPNGIKADPESMLIFSPSHFTWMDTNYPAGTPREGYPSEIQALWYAALSFRNRNVEAGKVQNSIRALFFTNGHASDCLHCTPGIPAAEAEPDDHIRPNVLLFITLGAVTEKELQLAILRDCAGLLVPGAIRTLDDREVKYPNPVYKDGELLNDPYHPYRGIYAGPEDRSRKVAYHNGTAWCWCFPAFCEALCLCGGKAEFDRASSLLCSGSEFFERAATGQLSEVADGDAPHRAGGCDAQAWSLSELFRVREFLKKFAKGESK